MSDHAHFWKCSLENNLFFFLTTIEMERWKLKQLEVEGHKPTKSEYGLEVDLMNC